MGARGLIRRGLTCFAMRRALPHSLFAGLSGAFLIVLGCHPRAHLAEAPPDPARCCDDTTRMAYEVPEVQEPPSFPGGEAAMYAWLGNEIAYPVVARENGMEGTSWVKFNVACDGSIRNVALARGSSIVLDTAAVNVVRRMPRWTPGKMKGEPVCVQYLLPVRYVLR